MTLLEKRKFYFRDFPKVNYVLDEETKEVTNFLHRWAFRKVIKENAAAYSAWIIRDQDTMFSISQKLYGSQHYYWIVLMMNDIIDPIFGWPLTDSDLRKYVQAKYGEENIYSIHHYEAGESGDISALEVGTIVSVDYPYTKTTVNNYDYEAELNEAKRKIKLLKPEYLDTVNRERESILANKFNRIVR